MSVDNSFKLKLFFFLRKIGGNRLPTSIKKPFGNYLIYDKDGSSLQDKRREFIASLVEQTINSNIEGEIMECGIAKGETTICIAKKLKELNSKKIIYGVDAFDTFPFDDNDRPFEKRKLLQKKYAKVSGTPWYSLEEVQENVDKNNLDNVKLVKGLVEDVLPSFSTKKFSFAMVDVDSYVATKQCLDFFKPHMSKGGIIFLDDYNNPSWAGAKKAADEVLGREKIIPLKFEQAYFINN